MPSACRVHYSGYFAILIIVILSFGCATTKDHLSGGNVGSAGAASGETVVSPAINPDERIFGTGDTVDIEVYRHADMTKSLRIDETGKINFPLIGDIKIAGMNAFQIRATIQEALSKYLVDPQVMINVKRMHSQKVYVLGEVYKPGVFTVDSPTSVLEAIANAGGFTQDAKNESVVVVKGNRTKPQMVKLDLESVLKKGNISQDIQIAGGDIVFVPSTYMADASRFAVYLKNILSPILMIEQGIVLGDEVADIAVGKDIRRQTTTVVIDPN